jgi:hypothetical protein
MEPLEVRGDWWVCFWEGTWLLLERCAWRLRLLPYTWTADQLHLPYPGSYIQPTLKEISSTREVKVCGDLTHPGMRTETAFLILELTKDGQNFSKQ